MPDEIRSEEIVVEQVQTGATTLSMRASEYLAEQTKRGET